MHEINTLLRENNQVRQNVYIRIDLIKNKPIAASMHLVLVSIGIPIWGWQPPVLGSRGCTNAHKVCTR